MDPYGAERERGTESQQTPSRHASTTLVEQGPNGEICVWYDDSLTFNFWVWGLPEWAQASHCSGQNAENGHKNGSHRDGSKSGDLGSAGSHNCESLQLFLIVEVPPRAVHGMCFMPKDFGAVFVSVCLDQAGAFVEARHDKLVHRLDLPAWFRPGPGAVKASSEFIVLHSVQGHLIVFQYERDAHDHSFGKFTLANETGALLSVYNHCTLPIVERESLRQVGNKDVLLRTATFDGSAVFDLVGTWLVYSPLKLEIEYFRRLHVSVNDNAANNRSDKNSVMHSMYTPVKLPLGNPLLLRMMTSLSNNAFDKLFQWSQFGSQKVRRYISSSDKIIDKDVSLHSLSKFLGRALYSTALKLKKQALSSGSNEYIKILDLANGRIMATFKPPGGISHLSLSPYDLHLIQASFRGDNFYMWDLYKTPKEVSLVENFTRGKTSAKTREVMWFVNDNNSDVLPGTNSGFGCITKESGSAHWYNINYLFCGNQTSNYPNTTSAGPAKITPPNGLFLDSWILPSNKAVKFLKLPRFSILKQSDVPGSSSSATGGSLGALTQLAFLDTDGFIRLLSPLNGKHTFKYVLPAKAHQQANTLREAKSTCDEEDEACSVGNEIPQYPKVNSGVRTRKFDVPLLQTEIETAAPYMSFLKNKKVEISRYDFGTDDPQAFYCAFATFGNDIPTVQQRIAKVSGANTPIDTSGELDGGVELNLENEYAADN